MRVAVVTPYYRTPNQWLQRCHASVRAQDYPCTLSLWPTVVRYRCYEHIVLPRNYGDTGDTPRSIGSLKAIEQGFDAIAYLDADNWYRTDHISSLIKLHQKTGAVVCTSKRYICHIDGRAMAICFLSDGEQFCDTSCLKLTRSAFNMVSVWSNIADGEHAIGDQIMWYNILKSGHSRAHTNLPTVYYRATHNMHYLEIGWPIPPGLHNPGETPKAHASWVARGNPAFKYTWRYLCLPQTKRPGK